MACKRVMAGAMVQQDGAGVKSASDDGARLAARSAQYPSNATGSKRPQSRSRPCGPAASPASIALDGPPNVQGRQADLQTDQRERRRVPAPHDPHGVAEQEDPEADVASLLNLRRDQPRGDQRHHHRRPLQRGEQIGQCAACTRPMRAGEARRSVEEEICDHQHDRGDAENPA